MKKIFFFMVLVAIWLTGSMNMTAKEAISSPATDDVIHFLSQKYGSEKIALIERGVRQAARQWTEADGSEEEFKQFCQTYFIADPSEKDTVFAKLSNYFESISGNFNQVTLDLKWVVDIDKGEIHPLDRLFAAYSAGAHLTDDLYNNKIAFIIMLNFPYYTLEEKSRMGSTWTRKEWAQARLGDFYTARIPAYIIQNYSQISTAADMYIAEYNIMAGHLLNDKGETLFPKDKVLLSHWNLRDEIKANYSLPKGLEKQQMIFTVMNRIINQDIPELVINKSDYEWNPLTNKVFAKGAAVPFTPEKNRRYVHLLNVFKGLQAMDGFYPAGMNTYIQRKFDREMEMAQGEVEALFKKYVSSPLVKKVAGLIQKRIKRPLQPFDIWYNGFKDTQGIDESKLDEMTKNKYPTPADFEKDLVNILVKLGFSPEKARYICEKIVVDPARGSGHAWGAGMRAQKSHLRTRIGASGMDYKGYNIAVHEFGHNVEQTISLHNVDYYMMAGVPNTAFTEALAFIFQRHDLELLGSKETNVNARHLVTLDTFWSLYEIMGVSLIDMNVWKWLYNHPQATADELKEAVIGIAKNIWNQYYAPVFGSKNEPLLAIYSHMIGYPLYLSAYAYGEIINFQINQYLQNRNFAQEIERMYSQGVLIPQLWMKGAVGQEISVEPILKATAEALKYIRN